MLEKMVEQGVVFYVMGSLMMFGVFSKLVSYFTVRSMVKAAKEIQKSNHRLMRLVKAKFEHASMVSDKVQNVEAFVDKYIYEYKVFGISLNSWRTFPKKMLWIIGGVGVFFIFESYRIGGMSELFMESIQWTSMFVLSLLLFYFVADEKIRLAAAKNYMVEYLENVCIHRYAKMNMEAKTEEECVEEIVEQIKEESPVAEESVELVESSDEEQKKSEQEMRIRAILEEFFA